MNNTPNQIICYTTYFVFLLVSLLPISDEKRGNRVRCETRFDFAQKRTTIHIKNAPTHHEPVHQRQINVITKQIIYDVS